MDIKIDFKDFHGKIKSWSDNFIPTKRGQVGIFDSRLAMIGNVHEYGTTIKPKNADWLTIPANKISKGKRARSFNDLFFLKKSESTAFLIQKKTNILYYILKKEIVIPERSFMRSTINSQEVTNRVYKIASSLIKKVVSGNMHIDKWIEQVAINYSMEIKQTIYKGLQPSNSGLTLGLKSTTKPLIDTRKLVDSITHRLV